MSEKRKVTFTCPKCKGNEIEEILVDAAVASEVTTLEIIEDGAAFIGYGEQTNEGGHVDRYQCSGCGFTIVSDECEYDELTEDGLGEDALVKAIDILNKSEIKSETIRKIEMARMKDDGTWDTVMVDIPAGTHHLHVEESGRAAAEKQHGAQSSYSLYNSMDDEGSDT